MPEGARTATRAGARLAMREPAFLLGQQSNRRAVRDAIAELCVEKAWHLAALHVRTTHVHLIVDPGGATPERVLQSCKAYATRALKEAAAGFPREIFWTRSGDIRRLAERAAQERAIQYVLDGQGKPMEIHCAP